MSTRSLPYQEQLILALEYEKLKYEQLLQSRFPLNVLPPPVIPPADPNISALQRCMSLLPQYQPQQHQFSAVPHNFQHCHHQSLPQPSLEPLPLQAYHPTSEASVKVWRGEIALGRRITATTNFSNKVFIGGISKHVTEEVVRDTFTKFDPGLQIVWPDNRAKNQTKGYLYLIMSSNAHVTRLLSYCDSRTVEGGFETFNLDISYQRKHKQLQVVPWILSDNRFRQSYFNAVPEKKLTVFVGALHGRLHARAIAQIFSELFGAVLEVIIDTDQHKYPTGFGRITFLNKESYIRAITANYVQIECTKINKRVQIEPFIDGQECSTCGEGEVPNFCKDLSCFNFYCNSCWLHRHNLFGFGGHQPVRRKAKTVKNNM